MAAECGRVGSGMHDTNYMLHSADLLQLFANHSLGQHTKVYGAVLGYELVALIPGLIYTVSYEVCP